MLHAYLQPLIQTVKMEHMQAIIRACHLVTRKKALYANGTLRKQFSFNFLSLVLCSEALLFRCNITQVFEAWRSYLLKEGCNSRTHVQKSFLGLFREEILLNSNKPTGYLDS